MATREELKALIDQLPEEKLGLASLNLESILHPPALNPESNSLDSAQKNSRSSYPSDSSNCRREAILVSSAVLVWSGEPGAWVPVDGKRTVNIATPGKRSVRT
jgi:hypothetical protein